MQKKLGAGPLSLVGAAVAAQSMFGRSVAEVIEPEGNWLKRLETLTVHPKVPEAIRIDVKRVLELIASQRRAIAIQEQNLTQLEADNALLLEYFKASRHLQSTLGVPGEEGQTMTELVQMEHDAETRYEKARNACAKF